MIALIDGDIVAYRCAASNNIPDEGALEVTLLRVDKLMQDILYATEATSYRCFLTGKNNFRKKINPDYKAHRKDKEKPIWLQQCRDFLIQNWNAEVAEGCEADDELGMAQTNESIICTIDKDLDMIPGLHYNWVKNTIYEVNEDEALKFFYKQLLIGDTSDNIIGVRGIGPVKAKALIDHLETEEEMLDVVSSLYDSKERLCMNMECLYIWRQ